MRTFRVLVVAALATVTCATLASEASASAPTVSKTCKTLNKLNKDLSKVDVSGSKFNSDEFDGVSRAFRKAAKAKTVKGRLKSAMNTIADTYSDIAGADNAIDAASRLGSGGAGFSKAINVWSGYILSNCS